MIELELALVGLIIVTAVLVALVRGPIGATAVFAAFSLGLAIVWVLLAAPDVALTEAAVGAGVMVILLLVATVKTSIEEDVIRSDRKRPIRPINPAALTAVSTVALLLGYSVLSFPTFGDADAPTVSETDPTGATAPYAHYVGSAADPEVPNAVSSVLAVFRSLDTFGEMIVAFTAVIGVLIVLNRERSTSRSDRQQQSPAAEFPDPYVMSPVGMTAVRLVIPLVFAFGIYLILHGAVLPGGGFQGGVVIGASFILMALIFGHVPMSDWLDERIVVWALSIGVGTFVLVAIGGIAFGGTLFQVDVVPTSPVYVIDVIEIGIGVLVGAVVTALVLSLALGFVEEDADNPGGDRP